MDEHERPVVFTERPPGSGWLTAIGIISILLGILALLFPWWATLGIELTIGVFLLVIGVLELVRVFFDRPAGSTALGVIFGILAIVAGALLLIYPLQGALTLTLVLAAFFLLGGAFKTAASFTLRPTPGWGWMLASGIVSLLLGIIVLAALPGSAYWLLGVLFGIDLLFLGAAQVIFATAPRRTQRTGPI